MSKKPLTDIVLFAPCTTFTLLINVRLYVSSSQANAIRYNHSFDTMAKRIKIFFTEDNNTEAIILRLAFNSMQEVEVAHFTTAGALRARLHEQPDILILDLMLPDADGLEVLKEVHGQHSNIQVIVISAQNQISVIADTQKLGVFNYVVKGEGAIKYLRKTVENLISLIRGNTQP